MIYNLVQYLITNLPSYIYVANGFSPDSPQDAIAISDSGGTPQHWYDRTDYAVQFLSRAVSITKAKEQIDAVYALLKNRFGILLPQVTVDGVVYAQVQTYQISPIQSPAYIGADNENLEMFSFNVTITTK